jgi:hypothetical protein
MNCPTHEITLNYPSFGFSIIIRKIYYSLLNCKAISIHLSSALQACQIHSVTKIKNIST